MAEPRHKHYGPTAGHKGLPVSVPNPVEHGPELTESASCKYRSNDAQELAEPKIPLTYPELIKLDDDVLMQHLQNGHHDALAVIFDRYHRLVLDIAVRILRDASEAEDLTQSVFMEILKVVAQFDPSKGTTKVWLLQYAYHRSYNRRRYLALRGFYANRKECLPIEPESLRNSGTSFLGVLNSARAVEQAMKQLCKAQRITLQLAFYDGLTMHEIAGKTGQTFVVVRHNYYRGLEKLRLILCERPRVEATAISKGMAHVKP